ncbi:methyltransferase [uncultured Sulfitobacter sp.]|uniref:methyltransferase family protein n=1 Tax=uncultured Sulfitobacter sp. TaxID=191468 RepID=UPI0026266344|nr:methyltransferase [uncultured Sulfitobacter sp.]
MDDLKTLILLLGCAANLLLIAGILWSIFQPERRVWPPERSTATHKTIVWGMTCLGFGSTIILGFLEWGAFDFHWAIRWGLGFGLIVLGNAVVWSAVMQLGMGATSGDDGVLRSGGLYLFSRNPQYVADIAILIGIGLFSASILAWPVICTGIAALVLAVFAEERWLIDRFGDAYRNYLHTTRRFL